MQGKTFDAADSDALREALAFAVDYRGDVTITTRDGERVEGYVFDATGGRIRILPGGSDEKRAIEVASIVSLEFTGRDTAAGKSWQTWVRKYIEKKTAGEAANIEAERLE